MRNPPPPRRLPVLAALAAAAGLSSLSLFKHYSLDEFQYSHAAWLVAEGQVPHRDFFEFHFPLPYEALSLFYLWPDAGPERIRGLRVGVLLVLGFGLWAMAALNRSHGRLACAAAPLLAATAPSFVLHGLEVRPDPMAFALFLGALALLAGGPPGARRSLGSGVLLGLAVLMTQKVLLYGAPFAVALLVDLTVNRRGRPRLLGHPGAWLGGVLGVWALHAAVLFATGSAGAWWQQTWVFAYAHEQAYPAFPAARYLLPALRAHPGFFVLALLGLARSAVALATKPPLPGPLPYEGRGDALLMLSAGTTLFSFWFARAPFPYALVPFAGVAAIFAARACAWLVERGRGFALAALVLLVPVHGLSSLLDAARPDNAAQHRVLSTLNRLTAPTDPVWDSSGGASARPHVGFRFYTNAMIHQAEAATLGARVRDEVRAAQCTAALRDARFQYLPDEARAFVTEHFQPFDGDLWLWGQRFAKGSGGGAFEAVRSATYFVEPASLAADGTLRIDGQLISTPTFWLERGLHQVEHSGPPVELFVLWLPRSGERYRPDFEARPVFSTVF